MPVTRLLVFITLFVVGSRPLCADIGATAASGYLILTIAAGTGSGATPSVLSFPFQRVANAGGQMTGTVTGVTADTITNGSAGWTAGGLSQAATPYLIRFTSGTAAGRTFLLSTLVANSPTTVVLDPTDALSTDLTTLGILSGDTYQISSADTLSSVLGTPTTTGVLGSAAAPINCDQVQILQTGGWIWYYYNTTSNHWVRTSPPSTLADNVVIRPDTGVIYNRYAASPLAIMLTGLVPLVARQAAVFRSGPTALSSHWPISLTLGTSSIQTTPGWTSGATAGTADTVQIYTPGIGWTQYFYNGTDWCLAAAPTTISDDVPLVAGSMVIINKVGTTSGQAFLSQPLPYATAPSP